MPRPPFEKISRIARRRRPPPPGTAPGTIIIDPEAAKPVVRVIAYGPDEVVEREVQSPDEVSEYLDRFAVVWINVDGLGDEAVLRKFGEMFKVHRLALEDVVNVFQRAKVETFPDHLFIIIRMVHSGARLQQEQISMFLGNGCVLSFQERKGDCFDPVRERIRHGRGRIRRAGADYLAYALIDAVIDAYFPVLESYGDRLEEIESQVMGRPDAEVVRRIHEIKRDLLALRRAVWPCREMVNALVREEHSQITPETRVYLRDCYDHVIQVIDMLETYREIASGQMDLYLSMIGQRTNDIMKVLTIFAAIFIPLTFIAGIYGMNFDFMPELNWPYAYPVVLAIMGAVAIGLLIFFYHRGWVGAGRRDRGSDRSDLAGRDEQADQKR